MNYKNDSWTYKPQRVTKAVSKCVRPQLEELTTLLIVIAIINLLLNIWSMRTFYVICRFSRHSQIIHQLLLYLTVSETLNMTCFVVKSFLYHYGFILKNHLIHMPPQTLSSMLAQYYLTMIFQSLSTITSGLKNIWLAVIAVIRGVAMLILLWRPHTAGARRTSAGESHHCWIAFLFCAALAVLATFRIVVYLVLESQVRLYICPQDTLTFEGSPLYYVKHIQMISRRHVVIIDWVHESLLYIIPFLTMATFNALIWFAMHRMVNNTSLSDTNTSLLHPRLKRLRHVSRTVMILISVYLFCEFPFLISHLIKFYVSPSCQVVRYMDYVMPLADVLVMFTTTFNILIYYAWEKVFQQYVREQSHDVFIRLQRLLHSCHMRSHTSPLPNNSQSSFNVTQHPSPVSISMSHSVKSPVVTVYTPPHSRNLEETRV